MPAIDVNHKRPSQPRGWAGTAIFSGKISGLEDNPELLDDLWPSTCLKMRRDGAVVQGILAHKDTALSARWSISPGDPEDNESQAVAEKLRLNLGLDGGQGLLNRSLEDITANCYEHEFEGWRTFEPLWKYIPSYGYALADLLDREPSSIYKWNMRDGALHSVTQRPVREENHPKMGVMLDIPASNLILFSRGRTGNNFQGRGLLRAAYPAWKLKIHSFVQLAVLMEKYGIGLPFAVADVKAALELNYKPEQIMEEYEIAQETLENLFSHESNALTGSPFIKFDKIGGDADPSKLISVLQYCDTEIAKAMNVNFLLLGTQDKSGSRAVGEVQENFFRRSIINRLDYIAGVWNGPSRPMGGIIGRWADLSWKASLNPKQLPKLVHSGLDVDPILQITDKLDLQNILITSDADRNHIRSKYGLPAMEASDV